MHKLGIFVSIATIVGALTVASFSASADSASPCVRKEFKTELVKQACAAGGQLDAKDAMKKWNKAHNITSCNKCHAKLAPNYELKADGLEQFKKLGGK